MVWRKKRMVTGCAMLIQMELFVMLSLFSEIQNKGRNLGEGSQILYLAIVSLLAGIFFFGNYVLHVRADSEEDPGERMKSILLWSYAACAVLFVLSFLHVAKDRWLHWIAGAALVAVSEGLEIIFQCWNTYRGEKFVLCCMGVTVLTLDLVLLFRFFSLGYLFLYVTAYFLFFLSQMVRSIQLHTLTRRQEDFGEI